MTSVTTHISWHVTGRICIICMHLETIVYSHSISKVYWLIKNTCISTAYIKWKKSCYMKHTISRVTQMVWESRYFIRVQNNALYIGSQSSVVVSGLFTPFSVVTASKLRGIHVLNPVVNTHTAIVLAYNTQRSLYFIVYNFLTRFTSTFPVSPS